jgi:hypothetical protein
MTSNKAEGHFGKQDFRYVAEEDVYTPTTARTRKIECSYDRNVIAGVF